MLSNVEHLSSTYWPSVGLIRKKSLFWTSAHFFNQIVFVLFCFVLLLGQVSSLYILIPILIMYMICKYFPPVSRLPFHFVHCSLYCVEAFFFLPYHVACGILIPGPGIQPRSPAVKAQSHSVDHQGIPAFWFDVVPLYFLPLFLVSFFFFLSTKTNVKVYVSSRNFMVSVSSLFHFEFSFLFACVGLHCCVQTFSSRGKWELLSSWGVQAPRCGGIFLQSTDPRVQGVQ